MAADKIADNAERVVERLQGGGSWDAVVRALGGADLIIADITRAAYEAFMRYLKCTGAEAELVEPPPPPGRPVEERYCRRYGLYCGEMRNYVKIYGVYRARRNSQM